MKYVRLLVAGLALASLPGCIEAARLGAARAQMADPAESARADAEVEAAFGNALSGVVAGQQMRLIRGR